MGMPPVEEPEPDCDNDVPLADELNKRADALMARIDEHLARWGGPDHSDRPPFLWSAGDGNETP